MLPDSPPLFHFESSDSLAQFSVWIVPVAGGGALPIVLASLGFLTWGTAAALAMLTLVLVAGLRSSIVVYPDEVKIVKKWCFLPYQVHRGEKIEDVSFGGDWGLEEGAIGVVVKIDGKEIHIGTSKNMRYLYEALTHVASTGLPFADAR
jgi:hypothetical protein